MVKALRKASARMKGDERMLSDMGFVEKVLKGAEGELERKYKFEAEGYDFGRVVRYVLSYWEWSHRMFEPVENTDSR